jgi:hypothetical protein
VQSVKPVFCQCLDPFYYFFRSSKGRTSGAVDNADEIQFFIILVTLKEPSALSHVSKTDNSSTVGILGAV